MQKSNKEIAVSSNNQVVESEEEIESSSSSSEEDESEIEREIADAKFEELQKARSDGSCSVYQKPKQDIKSGRANKNRWYVIPALSLCGRLDIDGAVMNDDIAVYKEGSAKIGCFNLEEEDKDCDGKEDQVLALKLNSSFRGFTEGMKSSIQDGDNIIAAINLLKFLRMTMEC
ncbi:hypothetical protein GH714_009906 [Hevea brasiliensis]|uniref:Uncharacterized protein n=1 Tax=Hevea brasiliensis TaxID=3981 RepID=A0A6A6MHM5_HEVBR|nr:hypothetical protein GH714_009906 [Hevea brasiliensis]